MHLVLLLVSLFVNECMVRGISERLYFVSCRIWDECARDRQRERVRERESCAMKGTFSTPLTLVQVGCSQLLREEDCKQHVQFAVSLYLAIGSGLAALPGCLQIRRSPAELTLGCQDFFKIVSIFLLQDAPSA